MPATSSWPVYHGGPDLAGATEFQLTDRPALRWQFHADGPIPQAPVSDAQGIYALTRLGTLIALDLAGTARWTKRLAESTETAAASRFDAPLACFRSTLFAGSSAGSLYALGTTDGTLRWMYNVGGPILGTVNLWAPSGSEESARLFVIKRDDGALHCIDFAAGTAQWQGRAIARSDGSVAIGDDVAVYGSCASALHVFSTQDARLLRSIELGEDCQVAAGPALAGDEVYSGSRSGRFVCANVRTGAIRWTNTDGKKEVFTTPAIGRDVVVFGSEDNGIYAVDRDSGKTRWRFDAHQVPTSPIIAADKVIFGAGGTLYFVRLESGEEVWKYDVSDAISSPAMIAGMVVVGSEDGTIMAFGDKQS